MGKKVDLNKPISSNTGNVRKSNHNFYRPNFNTGNNNYQTDGAASNEKPMPNAVQKKAAEMAISSMGVPKGIAHSLANDQRTYELADKVNATIMMPKVLKIVLPLILILLPLFAVAIFVVVFNSEDGSSSYGSFAFGQTCPTVTVVDTGCNGNAKNCTYAYDGDVAFEDYVAGVVAAEVGSANNLEYYKVAAIAARTFFLSHASSDCTVKGNATFQAYRDIETSGYADLIKQAVEETEGLILVKNGELVNTYYASACVVNADDTYYYVRYGTETLGGANFQKIPKQWDKEESVYRNYLASWYSMVDQSSTDYENKSCPNNHDYGMSQIGALYLITGEDYNYEEVIEYYYGEEAEIMSNEMQLGGVEGFVNPTRYINCSSPFGYRIHPVKGTQSFHTGLDIAVSGGEPIYAAQDGTVRSVVNNVTAINNCNYGYGNYIIIDHEGGTSTLYAHMKYGTIPSSIYAGAEVSQGEQIGQVGSTGCSTGNHLHYEVRVNNTQVDPADYIDLTGATGTCKR